MHFHFRCSLHMRIAIAIEKPHAQDILKSLPAHGASIHAQGTADFARDTFHPFQSANPGVASGICDLFQFCAHTCSDFVVVNFNAIEFASARMNNDAANSAVTDKQIRSATDDEQRQIFLTAKANQFCK